MHHAQMAMQHCATPSGAISTAKAKAEAKALSEHYSGQMHCPIEQAYTPSQTSLRRLPDSPLAQKLMPTLCTNPTAAEIRLQRLHAQEHVCLRHSNCIPEAHMLDRGATQADQLASFLAQEMSQALQQRWKDMQHVLDRLQERVVLHLPEGAISSRCTLSLPCDAFQRKPSACRGDWHAPPHFRPSAVCIWLQSIDEARGRGARSRPARSGCCRTPSPAHQQGTRCVPSQLQQAPSCLHHRTMQARRLCASHATLQPCKSEGRYCAGLKPGCAGPCCTAWTRAGAMCWRPWTRLPQAPP